MSSTSFRRPVFRLHLGYPLVSLTRGDDNQVLGTAVPDSPGFAAELRRMAGAVVRARGGLAVVLPEAEVWRGRLELAGRTPLARRRAARVAVAAQLGVPPDAVTVVLGPRQPDGATPVAAARRATLAETRALLAAVGLRRISIVGAGAFAGFTAPPRLGDRAWSLHGAALPVRDRFAALGAAAAVATAAALILAQPARPPARPLAVGDPIALEIVAPVAGVPHPPAQAAELQLLRSPPPVARPKSAAAVREPLVTVATRNAPLQLVEPTHGAAPELRLAELPPARARPIAAVTAGPAPRPAAAPAAAALESPSQVAAVRPMPRPGTPLPTAEPRQPAPAAADAGPSGRPLPRPVAPAPLVVASLDPAAIAVSGLAAAAAVPAPPARPAGLAAVSAAPRPVAHAAPVVVRPAPAVVRTVKVVRPAPVAPPRQVAAPVRQAAVAPVRQQVVVRKAPAAAPKPSAALAASAAAATERVGLSRGGVSLIGVFGGASGRHALLRMPNGAVERVSPGDNVQGIQVADVGTDSVRLRGGGRDTLLRLPD